MILVCGATGKQGVAVARHLLATEFKVRALTRDPEKTSARQLREDGVEHVAYPSVAGAADAATKSTDLASSSHPKD